MVGYTVLPVGVAETAIVAVDDMVIPSSTDDDVSVTSAVIVGDGVAVASVVVVEDDVAISSAVVVVDVVISSAVVVVDVVISSAVVVVDVVISSAVVVDDVLVPSIVVAVDDEDIIFVDVMTVITMLKLHQRRHACLYMMR